MIEGEADLSLMHTKLQNITDQRAALWAVLSGTAKTDQVKENLITNVWVGSLRISLKAKTDCEAYTNSTMIALSSY